MQINIEDETMNCIRICSSFRQFATLLCSNKRNPMLNVQTADKIERGRLAHEPTIARSFNSRSYLFHFAIGFLFYTVDFTCARAQSVRTRSPAHNTLPKTIIFRVLVQVHLLRELNRKVKTPSKK